MPVDVWDKIVKAFSGTTGIADAVDIETTGASNVQGDLDGLKATTDSLGTSIWNWKFNAAVVNATDPGANFMALNNAAKASATIATFSTSSNMASANFDEWLGLLDIDDIFFVQERIAPANAALYRVTDQADTDGTRVNVAVANVRTQGSEFTANAVLNVGFLPQGAGAALRYLRDSNNAIETVDATDATTFASSLSGITPTVGQAFRVATAGSPFTGQTARVEVGDIIAASVDGPSLTDITNWVVVPRAAAALSVNDVGFLDQITFANSEYDLGSDIKLGTDNFDDQLAQDYARLHQGSSGQPTSLTAALTDFEQHLTVTPISAATWGVPSNPQSYRGTITRKFAAYWDEQRTGASPFTGNYFDDLADPTITLSGGVNYFFTAATAADASVNNRFPDKQSYFTGKLDVSGLPLTNTETKIIAFSHHVNAAIPTTDTPLLRAGSRELIGADASGLYVLAGNSDGTLATATSDQRLPETGTGFAVGSNAGNTIIYLSGVGTVNKQLDALTQTFHGNTVVYPLAITFRWKRIQNGEAGSEVTSAYTITDRDVSQAQTTQAISIPTLPSGSANEDITFEYNGTTHILTVGTPGISTNTSANVSQLAFEATFADSQGINTSTTSSKVRFDDARAETPGSTIDLIFLLEPTIGNDTSADKFLSLKAVVDGHQESNVPLNFRASAYDFSNLIFGPDSGDNIAIANIQVYEYDTGGSAFNTPTHADLYRMYQYRSRWLGLFNHPTENYRRYVVDGDIEITRIDDTSLQLTPTRVFVAADVNNTTQSVTISVAQLNDHEFMNALGYEKGTPDKWFDATVPTDVMTSGEFKSTDRIEAGGTQAFTWNLGTTTLSTTSTDMEIYAVILS